jgi:hypothetical protein
VKPEPKIVTHDPELIPGVNEAPLTALGVSPEAAGDKVMLAV